VLKINSLYAYQENGFVDIVRVTDVLIERGYILCSLFFTSKNKIITVRHTLKKGTYVLWRLMDNEEFEEIMSRKLWKEVDNMDELLEFDY
jgi:predicted thioredoxin/glutaredoxin